MDHDDALVSQIRQRLRRAPKESVVSLIPAGAFPSPFFGNIFAARVATVGLNPAGPDVFFQAPSRTDAPDDQCDEAISILCSYFQRQGVQSWFSHLQRVLEGMALTGYWDTAQDRDGDTVHLDLVQEPTTSKWSRLTKSDRDTLLAADLPFLKWTIEAFPFIIVLCDGSTALDHVYQLLAASEMDAKTIQMPTVYFRQSVHVAVVNGRTVGIAGWSDPLNRPTGLTAQDKRTLGEWISEKLRAIGLPF